MKEKDDYILSEKEMIFYYDNYDEYAGYLVNGKEYLMSGDKNYEIWKSIAEHISNGGKY